MFLPQNNSGLGNGSELAAPFAELMKTFDKARGSKNTQDDEVTSQQRSSHFAAIFKFLPSHKSNKAADATV